MTVSFGYDPDDPAAFTMTFKASKHNDEVVWQAALGLLREGLYGPAGLADVQVWPEDDDKVPMIAIQLGSDAGESTTRVPATAVTGFIKAVDDYEAEAATKADEVIELAIDNYLSQLGLTPGNWSGFVPNPGGPSQPGGWCNLCSRVHANEECDD